MKTTIKLTIAFALALATFSQHTAASAGGVFKARGKGASANFSSVDTSGCVFTDVFVNPNEGFFQSPPGPGSASSGVLLAISQYDACAGVQLLAAEGFAPLGDPDFQVFGNLQSATLTATVNVFDFVTGTSFDVFVDLTWTGTANFVNREKGHSHIDFPGCKINTRFDLVFRPAVATGSISDGSTNYTPEPSFGHDIFKAKNMDVVIGCN